VGAGPGNVDGEFYHLDDITIGTAPRRPPPIWFGGGGTSSAAFPAAVGQLRADLERAGRDPATFPISKRVFLAVDDDAAVARAELTRWFTDVYGNPDAVDTAGVHGTPGQVKEQLDALLAAGATHLLLNPVDRLLDHVDVLADLVGLEHRRVRPEWSG
jgi:alkanesulfonate monooxygenase SsuD/methylene tetrahydromethanopterin reductase-like flavin-dependent oxidoreductase (luciferase family)